VKKAKYPLLILAALLIALSSPLTYAAPPATVNIYAWTDKAIYEPGESGNLTIVIRNDRMDVDLILYNITIEYPWFAYTGKEWDGNDTIIVNDQLMKGEVKTFVRKFTVPSNGRVTNCMLQPKEIKITAYVNEYPYHYSPEEGKKPIIYVRSMPLYSVSVIDWDKAITLFTIQAVLLIVCTIIIAAVIFLSTRRPKAIWVEEEEKEKSE
jgi:hypothetical protein